MLKATFGFYILPLFVLVATVSLATAGPLTEKPTPFPEDWPYAAPWHLNKELLDPPENLRMVFVIDHVSGHKPDAVALDHLVRLAAKYSERPVKWIRSTDPESPSLPLPGSTQPSAAESNNDITETKYIFIRYVGKGTGSLGKGDFATGGTVALPNGSTAYVITIAQDRIRRYRLLWITGRYLEQRTLFHEFGHILGLATNPEHSYLLQYPSMYGGPHCINPNCAITLPTRKAITYTLLRTLLMFHRVKDYCAFCQKDIELAKRVWRNGETFPPSARRTYAEPLVRGLSLSSTDLVNKTPEEIIALLNPLSHALILPDQSLPEGWPSEILVHDITKTGKPIVLWQSRAGSRWAPFDWFSKDESADSPGRFSAAEESGGKLLTPAYIYARSMRGQRSATPAPVLRLLFNSHNLCVQTSRPMHGRGNPIGRAN